MNNPHDWWFYACKRCWRKMVPTCNIRKCPDYGGTEDDQAATKETITLIGTPATTQNQSEIDKASEATPVRDIVDSVCVDAGEDTTSTTDRKKRKSTTSGRRTLKKGSSSDNKGSAKALFSPDREAYLN